MSSNSIFNSTSIPVLEQVVNFTQARQGVLAGNIANMDTPGYRTRDLSPEMFQEKLKEAIENKNTRSAQGSSYDATNQLFKNTEDLSQVSKSLEGILFHDESNVSIEKQIAQISKNQMQHNLAITIMTSQFRLLQAAISERPT